MDFSTLLKLITTTGIAAGSIFAGVQLMQFIRQRERESAFHMLNSFRTVEFMTGHSLIFNMPEDLSKEEIEQYVGDKKVYLFVLLGTFESLGIMVFRREVSMNLVDDFFSGSIVTTWRKLSIYIKAIRDQNQRETFSEWFQWLAEQFERRESRHPDIPAYIEFRNWREKKLSRIK